MSIAADQASTDESFVKEAARGSQMEVELGRMAQQKSTNQEVRQLAAMLAQEHQAAYQQLQTIATKHNIQLPKQESGEAQKDPNMQKLSDLQGQQFDRQFVQTVIDEHQKDIQEFQNQARTSQNADVKQFATATLPKLQQHLQMAQRVQASLAQGSAARPGEQPIDVSRQQEAGAQQPAGQQSR